MNILFLTKYGRAGASSRYRFYNYEKYFNNQEVVPVFMPLLPDNYVEALYGQRGYRVLLLQIVSIINRFWYLLSLPQKSFDLIVIEKELFPNMPWFIEKFLLRNKRYMLDYDDYVGASYMSGFRKLFLKNKIINLVKNAHSVTVGNRWYFEEFGTDNLIYLPTVIDIEKYPVYRETPEKEIVWIGSPSTVKYLTIVENVLIALSEEFDFTLKIIGGDLPLDKRVKKKVIQWNSETENMEISTALVGIMPLYQTRWENGKCGFKLIQYMASGIPVIGSPLPANQEIITQETGFLCTSEEEWYTAIRNIFEDYELRKMMAVNSRVRIEKYYTYQVWGPIYAKILVDNAS